MFWMINNQRFWLTTQSKGDHKKGLHTTQIRKNNNKEKKEKKLSVYFPRQISKQFYPFFARKRKREICLTLMIWGLSLFWKSYNIWRLRGRIGHLSFNGGEEPDHKGTNQPGRNSKKGNPSKTLTIFDEHQIYFRQEPGALHLSLIHIWRCRRS